MAKTKEVKTNAMRILDTAGIPYEIHTYDTQDGAIDGVSVAEKCGQDPEQVFKTLVTVGEDRNHYVFVIPVKEKLDLKRAARTAGVKSIEMIHQKELFPLTGYIHGGCSPVGMKKPFPTWFDETAVLFDAICVSGGKVGVQVEVNPNDLVNLIDGAFAEITV
ncbi:MAG: Cys-tRNA(Pro) deacylase [Solobacterium sp.]|nr:Cys-tRNA(Pro) deacylase [Solobacterium sp.]